MAPAKNDESDKPKRPKRHRKLPPKDTEEYRVRRDRNNDAVRKSRDKARERASETMERVSRLKAENARLEQQVCILSKELGVLRDLFKMVHTDSASQQGQSSPSAATLHTLPQMKQEACEAELPCDEATVPVTYVNQDALQKDHEYFSSPKTL